MPAGWGTDILALAASIGILALYHGYLAFRVRRNPAFTLQSVTVLARTAWVRTVMAEGRDILAVQTLRNSTMAATFLASTSVLLAVGVLTLSGQGDKLGLTWHALNPGSHADPGLWELKLILLLLDLFVAFFAFSLSIRVFNHVGYMINVPQALGYKAVSPDKVAAHLNRAGRLYGIGMRAYYLMVPLVLWLFGPYFMLGATGVLVPILFVVDRAPKILEEEKG